MHYFILSTILTGVLLMDGCSNRSRTENIRHYVTTYYNTKTTSLLTDTIQGAKISLYFDLSNLHSDELVCFSSIGDNARLYDSLCVANNDLAYPKKTEYIGMPIGRFYGVEQVMQIDITCEELFDADHPKGTSLNDCVTFLAFSPKTFIESNYQQTYDWQAANAELREAYRSLIYNTIPEYLNNHHPISCLLSDFPTEGLRLLGTGAFSFLSFSDHHNQVQIIGILDFAKKPDVSGYYPFNVQLSLADGQLLESRIVVRFP